MPRNLQWTRFDEAKPTNESKALAVQYWRDGGMYVYQPGTWRVESPWSNAKSWAMDDPIAPPREPDEMPEELWAWAYPESGGLRGEWDAKRYNAPNPLALTTYVKKPPASADPDEILPGDDERAYYEPADPERVVVSIKALRMLKKCIGVDDGYAEAYLDEIIDSAEPVGEKTCR